MGDEITLYLDDYEFRGDDGDHTPTDDERLLIEDAMRGFESAQIESLRERLDIAESALLRHGYRKSCGIPACNCGDQWNHGGHANARLDEIGSATRDHYRNGELLLTRVQRIVATAERHEAFVRSVREIAGRTIGRSSNGNNAIGALNTISALCDAELGKEQK